MSLQKLTLREFLEDHINQYVYLDYAARYDCELSQYFLNHLSEDWLNEKDYYFNDDDPSDHYDVYVSI